MTGLWHSLSGWGRGWFYRHDWQLAIGLALMILAGSAWLLWPKPVASPAPAPLPVAELETAQERWVIVHVTGAVVHPGLYRLKANLRVSDAIVAAGGVTQGADQAHLPNLAAHLRDGKQIVVPVQGRRTRSHRDRLDVNTASRDELLGLEGIDPALADAIIAHRDTNGGFQRLAELKSALGVDAVLYRRLQKVLTVG